jgi:hypothetical protein
MSDTQFIREIDEDLRRDRLLKLWERYGIYAIAAAFLVVAATAGWRGWEWYQTREGIKAGSRFEAALVLAESGKHAEAEQDFDALTKDSIWGYRLLARMRLAAETGTHDTAAGAAAYDAIIADGSIDAAIRDVARLRAAFLLLDTAQAAEIAARVEPLIVSASPFRFSARETLALARYKAGEREAARAMFAELAVDPQTPPALRTRAEVMQALASVGTDPSAKPGSATQ